MALDLLTPATAVADARALRESTLRTGRDDAARRQRFEVALEALASCWTEDHKAATRTGARTGRSVSQDPLHVLARERRAEIKALRGLLRHSSGTPRPTARTMSAQQMGGRLARSIQVLVGLDREHRTARKMFGTGSWTTVKGGGSFRSMRELNTEAGRLLGELQTERRALRTAWEAYERHRSDDDPYGDAFDALAERLKAVRDDFDELTAELRQSIRQREPLAAEHKAWTFDHALHSLKRFKADTGRAPTKAECHPNHGLPHYTQLRRLLGPSPLTTI